MKDSVLESISTLSCGPAHQGTMRPRQAPDRPAERLRSFRHEAGAVSAKTLAPCALGRRALFFGMAVPEYLAIRIAAISGHALVRIEPSDMGEWLTSHGAQLRSAMVLGIQGNFPPPVLQPILTATAAIDLSLGLVLGADDDQLQVLVDDYLRRLTEPVSRIGAADLVSSFSLPLTDKFASAACETRAFEEMEEVDRKPRAIVALAGFGKPIDMLIGPALKLCGKLGNGLYRGEVAQRHTCQLCDRCPADPEGVKDSTSVADLDAEILYLAACSTASLGSVVFRRDLQLLNAAFEAGTSAVIAITRSGASWAGDPLLMRALLRSGVSTGEAVAIMNAIHAEKGAGDTGHVLFGDPDLRLEGSLASEAWAQLDESSINGAMECTLQVRTAATLISLAGIPWDTTVGLKCVFKHADSELTDQVLMELLMWRGVQHVLVVLPDRLVEKAGSLVFSVQESSLTGRPSSLDDCRDPFEGIPALDAFRLGLLAGRRDSAATGLRQFMDAATHAALACSERHGGRVDWHDTTFLEKLRAQQDAAVKACALAVPTQLSQVLPHWRLFGGQRVVDMPCECCGTNAIDGVIASGVVAALGNRVTRDCRRCTFSSYSTPELDGRLGLRLRWMEPFKDCSETRYCCEITVTNRLMSPLVLSISPVLDGRVPWARMTARLDIESVVLAAQESVSLTLMLDVGNEQPGGLVYAGLFLIGNFDFGAMRVPLVHQ